MFDFTKLCELSYFPYLEVYVYLGSRLFNLLNDSLCV